MPSPLANDAFVRLFDGLPEGVFIGFVTRTESATLAVRVIQKANRMVQRKVIFQAIQIPISFIPNISGITPFHNHMAGKQRTMLTPKARRISRRIALSAIKYFIVA